MKSTTKLTGKTTFQTMFFVIFFITCTQKLHGRNHSTKTLQLNSFLNLHISRTLTTWTSCRLHSSNNSKSIGYHVTLTSFHHLWLTWRIMTSEQSTSATLNYTWPYYKSSSSCVSPGGSHFTYQFHYFNWLLNSILNLRVHLSRFILKNADESRLYWLDMSRIWRSPTTRRV